MCTARALLGDDCVLLASGVVDTDAGTSVGETHRGGAHLLRDPLAGAAAAPPHCITVFIPLVDVVDGGTGGTAFWPRSHHGVGWKPPASPTKDDDDGDVDGGVGVGVTDEDDMTAAVSPSMRAGDAILFDSRLTHKSLANTTGARLPAGKPYKSSKK